MRPRLLQHMRAQPTVFSGALLLLPGTGCTARGGYTIVEKRVTAAHFKFVPVVKQGEPGPGGWRAACLYLRIAHDDGRAFMCKVGVEVPMETEELGSIPVSRAQRLAARCANKAADIALGATTAATPLGIACTSFIGAYRVTLARELLGSRVGPVCRPEAEFANSP